MEAHVFLLGGRQGELSPLFVFDHLSSHQIHAVPGGWSWVCVGNGSLRVHVCVCAQLCGSASPPKLQGTAASPCPLTQGLAGSH